MMVGLDDAVKQGTKEGIEESIEQTIKQSSKQIIEESMTTATKSSLEATFGRQIPKSYLDATGEQLTKSGAEKFYRTSVRRMIREGGENGPKQALEATVKALGVSQAEAAEIVVGNLGVQLSRQGADEAVQAALKASGRSLKEIICATPSVIRGFLRSVYDNAIRLGKNPKQALRQTKKLKESIAFKRAALVLGVPAAGAVIIGAGYSIYNIVSDMGSAASNPSEEQAETQAEEPPSTPSQVIGQSIIGLSAIGIGGIALLSVMALGGKKDKAVAASEEGDFVCADCGLVFVGDKPDVCDDCGCTDIQPMLQDKGWDPRDVHNPWKTPPEDDQTRIRRRLRKDPVPKIRMDPSDRYDELMRERRERRDRLLERMRRREQGRFKIPRVPEEDDEDDDDDDDDMGGFGFDQIPDPWFEDQLDDMVEEAVGKMRDDGMAIGPVKRISPEGYGLSTKILTDAEEAEACDLARLFYEDNEEEIREVMAEARMEYHDLDKALELPGYIPVELDWESWWNQRNPFPDKSRHQRNSLRTHFKMCLQELIKQMR